MSQTVYVIVGATGEMDAFTDWNVHAFASREQAATVCDALNRWCLDRGFHRTQEMGGWDGDERPPDDPRFYCSWPGTHYTLTRLEMD